MQLPAAMARAVLAGRAGDTATAEQLRETFHHTKPQPGDDLGFHRPALMALCLVAECAHRDGWGTPVQDLRTALDTVGDVPGRDWIERRLRQLDEDGTHQRTRGRGRVELPDALVAYGITAREAEVLTLLRGRLSNREIAERLGVGPSTIKTHVERLLAKTGRRNRRELGELGDTIAKEAHGADD